jgi:hypothetical protein
VTEALVMTALGAPQALYNGGLQYATVRYLDPETGRPGLPPRVAALVESIGPDRIIVQLVNLAESDTCLIVQTGGFAEYEIVAAEGVDADGGDPAHVDSRGASRVVVQVPGRSRVRVTLEVVPSRGGATLRGTAR